MNPLDGRILLTGAAGGLGTAIAHSLSGRARPLVLSARRADQVAGLASDLGAEVLQADLEDRAQLLDLVHQAGEVDLAVLNAALPASGPLLDYDIDQIDRALEVNLRAPLVMARLLAEGMVSRGRGQIVFISSLAGKAASPGTVLYSGTKFGIRGASLSLRQDLEGTGVGVSVICPSFVSDAGMFADSGARLPKGLKTVSPQQVADATIAAVEQNRAEIDVAPLTLKLAAAFAQLAPQLAARGQKLSGGGKLSEFMADQQRSKR
jgi:short-subunit dehydrogenase